jgi:hypothetical protein
MNQAAIFAPFLNKLAQASSQAAHEPIELHISKFNMKQSYQS